MSFLSNLASQVGKELGISGPGGLFGSGAMDPGLRHEFGVSDDTAALKDAGKVGGKSAPRIHSVNDYLAMAQSLVGGQGQAPPPQPTQFAPMQQGTPFLDQMRQAPPIQRPMMPQGAPMMFQPPQRGPYGY